MRTRLLPLLVLCLLVLPSQALADTHPFLGTQAKGFDDICGVAAENNGTVYVSDYNSRRVSVFVNGAFQYAIPSAMPENSPCDLATDSSSRLYGNYLHQGVVELFGATTIDPGRSTGISVNPLNDRLYVAHRTHVSVYEPDGSPVPLTIGTGSLGDAYGVAVSAASGTEGYVYVGDASDNTIKVFKPATDPLNPIQVIDGASDPQGGFNDLTDTDIAIDQVNGHVYVVDNLQPHQEKPAAALDEFDSAGAYVSQITHWIEELPPPAGSQAPPFFFNRSLVHGAPSGVAVDAAGKIYVGSGNEDDAFLYGFGPTTVTLSQVRVTKAGTGSGAVKSQLNLLSKPLPPVPPSTDPPVPDSSPFSGIDCGLVCTSEYVLPALNKSGEVVNPQPSFVATAASHSRFTGWSGDCSGKGLCNPTLGGVVEVTANFEALPQQTMTVAKLGTGAGLVSSSPVGIDCGPTCTSGFDAGTELTLTAEESPGSTFSGWSGACSGAAAVCHVTLDKAQDASATFTPIPPPTSADPASKPRRLAITVGGTGSGTIVSNPAGIECGTPCSAVYPPGTVISLSATADSDSHFSGWSGCDSVVGNHCTVTLGTSKIVSAGFEEGATVKLGTFLHKGGTGILPVTVVGPGSLKVSGQNLSPSTTRVTKAGSINLPVELSKTGSKALAKSKGSLRVKVAVTFTPSGGGDPVTQRKTIVFKKRNGKS
jgi:hypothetical protein